MSGTLKPLQNAGESLERDAQADGILSGTLKPLTSERSARGNDAGRGRKVFLIVPPTGRFIREDRCQTPIDKLKTVALRPPIDLMYVAGAFESVGCDCRLVDYPAEELGWDHLERELREWSPDFLVMSITTPSLDADLAAATLARKINPAIRTVAKGAHFNTLDLDTVEKCPDLDLVIRGEYEETAMELGRGRPFAEVAGITWRDRATGKVTRNVARPLTPELDVLPFPARHLVKNELYPRPDNGLPQTTLVTNRGCPHTCSYCLAQQVSGARNRYRSVENVLAEIKECVEKYGIRNFLFRSDLFTQNRKWVIRLCEAILEAKLDIQWVCNSRVDTINEETLTWMKKAGCWVIAFGTESGSQDTLDRIRKKATVEQAYEAIAMTRRAGIKSSVYLLFGLPWDTDETLRVQSDFARKLDPDYLEVFFIYPFPGTTMYDECVAAGLMKAGEIPKEAYGEPAMPTLHLTAEELVAWRKRALREFYFRPAYIWRTLRSAGSPRAAANYLRVGWNQMLDLVSNGG